MAPPPARLVHHQLQSKYEHYFWLRSAVNREYLIVMQSAKGLAEKMLSRAHEIASRGSDLASRCLENARCYIRWPIKDIERKIIISFVGNIISYEQNNNFSFNVPYGPL